jgi:ATP-dependent Clp protease protease subunit
MSEPSLPPEFPYPFPPGREPPRRTEPVNVPLVDLPGAEPYQRLFERRTVFVSGPLDGGAVTHMCAQLMALDGRSERDVELVINSTGGPSTDVAAALDVIEAMRGKVNATCTGTAQGTAAVLLACATGERRAGRHARISLRLQDVELVTASAADFARKAKEIATVRDQLIDVLASATGQPSQIVARELDAGDVHDARAALALGLIDRVLEPPDRAASPT